MSGTRCQTCGSSDHSRPIFERRGEVAGVPLIVSCSVPRDVVLAIPPNGHSAKIINLSFGDRP